MLSSFFKNAFATLEQSVDVKSQLLPLSPVADRSFQFKALKVQNILTLLWLIEKQHIFLLLEKHVSFVNLIAIFLQNFLVMLQKI